MAAAGAGHTSAEARRLLEELGPNEIPREEGRSPARMFVQQLRSPMIALLAAAAVLSGAVGETADAIAIAAILIINAVVGFLQEYRAERAVLALRSMTSPRARVVRDGRTVVIAAAEVVPGDLVVLEAGDVVPADAKLTEAHRLKTDEAALTGESAPVDKSPGASAPDTPLAERSEQVFLGTAVADGAGRAVVTATGMHTELGKIAHLLATAEDSATPLQVRLAVVSRSLLILSLALVAVVLVLGFIRSEPWLALTLTAVSLAVAAVPEGLPAIVTIALAVGVQRMADRNVLVRRLPAVETLGCATVICTDKTGTLTTGRMAVRDVWGVDRAEILRAAAASSNAELDGTGRWGTGDPTELALLVAAGELGIRREDLERSNPRVAEFPFDATRKRMSVRRSDGVLYVKGAVDLLIPLCREGTEGAEQVNQQFASRGLRVLGIAVGNRDEEKDLRLLGLVGIADPPRTEAIEAVAAARDAGIRTVMITGDHPITAAAIARELGILRPGEDASELVHARATPEDKLKIISDWKRRGDVVAMTGDGVNDAPALRAADIGVAMGRTGTEVTREASDMVLADDNFASIVAAVREGRAIYDNIRKTLVYLLAGNAGELLVVLGAALVGLPVPLLPLHLLWINLVTDGLPALALVMDPPEGDVLDRPPRPPAEQMLRRTEWRTILLTGLLQAAVTLTVFVWTFRIDGLEAARMMAFSVLVFGEVLRAFAARSPTRLFWEVGAFSNLKLIGVVAATVFAQIAIHHLPFTQALFAVGHFTWADCGIALLVGLIPVSVIEMSKLLHRVMRARSAGPGAPPRDAGEPRDGGRLNQGASP